MSQPATPSMGRKVFKIVGIVLGCFVGFLLVSTILLLTFLEPVAGRFLKKQVVENTDGLYNIEFDDLRLNLLEGSIAMSAMHFYPDTAVHRQQLEKGEANPMLFQVATPSLEISHVNLLQAIFAKRISIGTVFLQKPDITLLWDKNAEGKESSDQLISDILKSLYIRKIDIPDATYRYLELGEQLHERHKVQRVSLLVQDLQIDSLDQSDHTRMLNAEDIQVQIKNYAYSSPDSVYDISVGLFAYSSGQGELVAEAVEIHSDHQKNTELHPDKASRSIYNIRTPRLHMAGLDVVEAFRTKQLLIERVLCENMAVEILLNTDIPTSAAYPELTDIYGNISRYLKVIGVSDIRITDGSLVQRNKTEDIITIHELEKIKISLKGLQVDSSTLFTPKENFLLEEALIAVEGYIYQHPHNPHTVKMGGLELSTSGNYVQADLIEVRGDWEKNDELKEIDKALYMVYNLNVPRLRLSNMDLIQAYKTSRLSIGNLEVEKPAISLYTDENVEVGDFDALLREVYKDVSAYITQLSTRRISLQDASFTQHVKKTNVSRTQKLEHGSFVATGLELDSLTLFGAKENIPVEEVVIMAQDYTYWLPDNTYTFALGSLRYSSRLQQLTARSIDVTPNRQANRRQQRLKGASQSLYDISASQFRVTGLDIIRSMNTGRLEVDRVVLKRPELAIFYDRSIAAASGERQQNAPAAMFSLLNEIKARSVRLEDGTFTYREMRNEVIRTQQLDHASATITGLHLTPDRLSNLQNALPMQELVLEAKGYVYSSPGGIYTISLDSLGYSSQQQVLTARTFRIMSDKEVQDSLKVHRSEEANRNLFDVSATKFQVKGLDLLHAYETGQYTMSEMLLAKPEVTILQDHNVPEQGQETDDGRDAAQEEEARGQIADIVETFRVQHLRVADGTFKLNILEDTTSRSQTVEHVSVALEAFRLANIDANDPLDMFEVDDVGVLVRDYAYLLPDSLYSFEVGEIRSSLRDQSLTVDSLRLVPLFEKDEYAARLRYAQDRYDLKVPSIRIQGMSLGTFFNNQQIIVQKALLGKPVLDIYRDNRVEQDPERHPLTLQNMLRHVPFYVKVDSILVEEGKITYAEIAPKGVQPGVLTLSDTKMALANVTNDSALIKQNSIAAFQGTTQLMGASKLDVQILLHLDHPEDLYTYKGTLEQMDMMEFNPLFEQMVFARIESGQINKAEFAVKATAHQAEGQMRFLYNDLQIQLIDKDDPENPGLLRKVGSWALNNFIIKSNNPTRIGNFRNGGIEVERDHQKSVFHHMSKAMMSGISSSLMPSLIERIAAIFVEDL